MHLPECRLLARADQDASCPYFCGEAFSEGRMYIKLTSSELLLYALAWQHALIRDMLGGLPHRHSTQGTAMGAIIGNDTLGICLHEGKACTAAPGGGAAGTGSQLDVVYNVRQAECVLWQGLGA